METVLVQRYARLAFYDFLAVKCPLNFLLWLRQVRIRRQNILATTKRVIDTVVINLPINFALLYPI
jgi:hypothetical protein